MKPWCTRAVPRLSLWGIYITNMFILSTKMTHISTYCLFVDIVDIDASVDRQNSEIGYVVLGLLVFVAVLVSVFRFICINWSTLPPVSCCPPYPCCPPIPPVLVESSVNCHPDRVRTPYSVAMTMDTAPPSYAESNARNAHTDVDSPPPYDSLFDRK